MVVLKALVAGWVIILRWIEKLSKIAHQIILTLCVIIISFHQFGHIHLEMLRQYTWFEEEIRWKLGADNVSDCNSRLETTSVWYWPHASHLEVAQHDRGQLRRSVATPENERYYWDERSRSQTQREIRKHPKLAVIQCHMTCLSIPARFSVSKKDAGPNMPNLSSRFCSLAPERGCRTVLSILTSLLLLLLPLTVPFSHFP